jgi:Putative restriction endonuclease
MGIFAGHFAILIGSLMSERSSYPKSPACLVTAQADLYTVDEYLTWEAEADARHEYRYGAILPMVSDTPTHNKLNSNLNALLWFGLKMNDSLGHFA